MEENKLYPEQFSAAKSLEVGLLVHSIMLCGISYRDFVFRHMFCSGREEQLTRNKTE